MLLKFSGTCASAGNFWATKKMVEKPFIEST